MQFTHKCGDEYKLFKRGKERRNIFDWPRKDSDIIRIGLQIENWKKLLK